MANQYIAGQTNRVVNLRMVAKSQVSIDVSCLVVTRSHCNHDPQY